MELEKRGTPVATICSSEFGALGRVEAESLGVPGLPIVVVPHPMGGIGAQEVRQKAKEAIDDLIHVLTESKESLEREYRGRYPKQRATFSAKPLSCEEGVCQSGDY